MIASLKGRLLAKDTTGAVVEAGGVGYGVSMSLSSLARLGEAGDEVQLLVHTHLSQDALRLYGFADAAERAVFEILIATSGVGPRLALAILSTLCPAELQEVVARGDKGTLNRIPGVGPKKAERLLLELKDRLKGAAVPMRDAGDQALFADLVSALANLGFKEALAEQAAKQALDAHPGEGELTVLVREALRATTRN